MITISLIFYNMIYNQLSKRNWRGKMTTILNLTTNSTLNDEKEVTLSNIIFKLTNIEIILLQSTFFFVTVLGAVLNTLILYFYCKCKKIRETSVIFILLMTINDLFLEIWETLQYFLMRGLKVDSFHPVMCIVTFSLGVTFYVQSEYFLLFTFIYRYVRINNPLSYHNYLTTKFSIFLIFGTLLFSLFASLFPVYTSIANFNGKGTCKGYYSFKNEYIPLIIVFVLPVILGVLIFHIKTLKIAKKHANLMENQMKQYKNISTSSKAYLIQLLIQLTLWILFTSALLKFVLEGKIIQAQKIVYGVTHLIVSQSFFNAIFTIFGNVQIKLEFYKLFHLKQSKIIPNEMN